MADYVWDVLNRFQRIYRERDGSLWLIRENGCRKCAVVRLAQRPSRAVYELITAYPLPRLPDFAPQGAVRLHYVP